MLSLSMKGKVCSYALDSMVIETTLPAFAVMVSLASFHETACLQKFDHQVVVGWLQYPSVVAVPCRHDRLVRPDRHLPPISWRCHGDSHVKDCPAQSLRDGSVYVTSVDLKLQVWNWIVYRCALYAEQ